MIRSLSWLIVLGCYANATGADDFSPEFFLKAAAEKAAEARQAAAADPVIVDRTSAPVKAYLAEQERRQVLRQNTLVKRFEEAQADPGKQDLVPVLKQQLADLSKAPPEQIRFDSAYGYSPATGLVGYSKRVRLLENVAGGKSLVLVDNVVLLMEGLGTSEYASGKFLGVDKAILIGGPGPEYTFQGTKRQQFTAKLVELEAILKAPPLDTKSSLEARSAPRLVGEYEEGPLTNRPKVPGVLRLNLRERKADPNDKTKVTANERTVDWNVAETAIIVCDMWDNHHCQLAAQRVGALAPKMNQVLTAARDRGVMIIHAPSETMNRYAGTPYRARLEKAPAVKPPVPIERRCDTDPTREPQPLPVDRKLDCDDPNLAPVIRRHARQHPAIDIIGFDGVSDSGEEIYNFCEQEGIKNLVIMGVHTNYCVLARSFGIRQNVRLGRNVVLARDLTDALYDPRQPPYVSHARGTELVVEHIERYWCPSIVSADLVQVVAGSDGPAPRNDARR
jgi:nicotinamidase-related amidase